MEQLESHPSPSKRLPSSHCSLPTLIPSPQRVKHGYPTGHTQPGSTVQSSKQPGEYGRSHCSAPVTTPFPQVAAGLQGCPGISHTALTSIWQLGEQPSPPVVLPSSQYSVSP